MTLNHFRSALLCVVAAALQLSSGVSAQAARTHIIGKGDSVDSLARKYGVPVKMICHANMIKPETLLRDGRKLNIPDPPKPVIKGASLNSPGHICGDRVTVRFGPGESYRRVALFDHGAPVTQLHKSGEWSQVKLKDSKIGWTKTALLSTAGTKSCRVAMESPEKTARRLAMGLSFPTRTARRATSGVQRIASHRTRRTRSYYRTARRSRPEAAAPDADSGVIRTAYAYRGVKYRFGGSSRNGIDCSGLTSKVYSQHGVSLPHSAKAQFTQGNKVAKDNLKAGDLVFFHTTRRGISHVGIYAGKGKFVHASSGSGKVRVDSLNDGYYANRYRGARRVK